MPLPDVLTEDDSWMHLSINSFDQLIRTRSNARNDDRVCAIEVQIDREIALVNRVEALILPAAYLQIEGVAQQIDGWGATAIPYNLGYEFIPREIIGVFWQTIRDYLSDAGRL